MTTPALTVADFGVKFAAISGYVTPAVLATINQSETMKASIRDYEKNDSVAKVQMVKEMVKGVELNCRLSPCRQRRLLTTMKIQFDPFDPVFRPTT